MVLPRPNQEPELEPEPEPFAAPYIEEVKRPARVTPRSIEIEEIDRLSRELGLNLKYVEPAAEQATPTLAPVDEGDVFDFGAALDRARNQASGRQSIEIPQAGLDEEAIRQAAIAEARADAER